MNQYDKNQDFFEQRRIFLLNQVKVQQDISKMFEKPIKQKNTELN